MSVCTLLYYGSTHNSGVHVHCTAVPNSSDGARADACVRRRLSPCFAAATTATAASPVCAFRLSTAPASGHPFAALARDARHRSTTDGAANDVMRMSCCEQHPELCCGTCLAGAERRSCCLRRGLYTPWPPSGRSQRCQRSVGWLSSMWMVPCALASCSSSWHILSHATRELLGLLSRTTRASLLSASLLGPRTNRR